MGNGYVYSSAFCSDEAARAALAANMSGEPQGEATTIRFTPGRRRKAWNRNCVALGLAAGFLEPLEATSIHMVQRGVSLLLKFFPNLDYAQADIDRYNRILEFEFGRVRDFLLMHYAHTEREEPFWAFCRALPLTDSLKEKIELFRSHGRILREESELFPIMSWLSVMVGQNIIPRSHDPIVDGLDPQKVQAKLEDIAQRTRQCAEGMPPHWRYIEEAKLVG